MKLSQAKRVGRAIEKCIINKDFLKLAVINKCEWVIQLPYTKELIAREIMSFQLVTPTKDESFEIDYRDIFDILSYIYPAFVLEYIKNNLGKELKELVNE